MIVALLAPALASYVVEAPPRSSKAEASNYVRAARADGYRGRVSRRFVEGEGWIYVARWTFDELDEARTAARTLGERTGEPFDITGEDGAPVETDATSDGDEEARAPRAWMEEALEAHGAGAAVLADADTVVLRYTRELADGRVADHRLIRRGTDLRLEIRPKKGDVKPSVTVAAGDEAWLETDGRVSRQDLQRTREKLEGFALQSLAPLVLALDRAVRQHPELEEIVARGTAKVGGVRCEVAGTPDDRTLIAFGPDHRIRRLSVDGGKRAWVYADYRELRGVMIPYTIVRYVDGTKRDTTHIEEVILDAKVDGALFEPPN